MSWKSIQQFVKRSSQRRIIDKIKQSKSSDVEIIVASDVVSFPVESFSVRFSLVITCEKVKLKAIIRNIKVNDDFIGLFQINLKST